MKASALDKARAAWGELPDWLAALARACDEASQRQVAARLGYSVTTVNLVLANKYGGDPATLAAKVRDVLVEGGEVECPTRGMIPRRDCLEEQAKPWTSASSAAVRRWKACKDCDHNHGGKP